MIDWTKPLVVAGTDRPATAGPFDVGRRSVFADWIGDGRAYSVAILPSGQSGSGDHAVENAVTNAPPTPKIGPEHIEALVEAIAAMLDKMKEWETLAYNSDDTNYRAGCRTIAAAAEQRAARLAEIRAYLESL